jgi:voltage-gated potassium channel
MKDRRLFIIPIIFFSILIIGTLGYHWIESTFTFFEAFYLTAINISTLGYADVKPLTTAGRLFNLIIIVMAWIGIFIAARITGQMVIEGEIARFFGRKKMDKKLNSLSDHFIICGYGRVGRVVCEEFSRQNTSFVIIERNQEATKDIESKGYLYILGDCTQDQTLTAAGITRARGLINAIPDSADAVYTVLSARQHNQNLFIMARADSPSAEQMLKRAGADRVISPQAAAGARMAMAALRPNVVDFITLAAAGDETGGVRVEEIVVSEGSRLSGKSLKEVDIRAKFGLTVIGVRKSLGTLLFNPPADYAIQADDTLIIVGDVTQLARIGELFLGNQTGL